ncbi:MAG: DUF4912 domain-containing protein [Chthoniobacterales bacterium]
MDIDLKDNTPESAPDKGDATAEDSTYRISMQPVVSYGRSENRAEGLDLPRTYGTQTLTLMARDPRSIFAYWDIDWPAAFRNTEPENRKVHLRLLNADGSEEATMEIEPMAGSCYVTVPDANTTYGGEIGYFQPAEVWNSLASSELITTPPDAVAGSGEVDFATVPFHLTFQHMIDLLRISKQENESLTAMLADLRERAQSPESRLSEEQRDLAQILENADSGPRTPSRSTGWTQQRLEGILGFGNSSPTGGFGGSSRTR